QPAAVGELLLDGAREIAMPPHAIFDPFLLAPDGRWNLPRLDDGARDILEARARHQLLSAISVAAPVDLVAHDEAVVAVEDHEAFRHALDRVAQKRFRPLRLLQ